MRISFGKICLAVVVGLSSLETVAANLRLEDQREDETRGKRTCSLSMYEAGECSNNYYANANAHLVEEDGSIGNDTDHHSNHSSASLNNSVLVDTKITTKLASMMLKEDAIHKKDKKDFKVFKSRWGVDQVVSFKAIDIIAHVEDLIQETDMYMDNVVFQSPAYRNVRRQCKNLDKHCSEHAYIGYCEAHKDIMQVRCAPACRTCEMLDIEKRCPVDPDKSKDIWGPGDLNAVFERIANGTSPAEGLGPVEVLSRPRELRRLRQKGAGSRLPDGPWIVSMEQFLSEEECESLIELGDRQGYTAPELNGETRLDGTGGIRSLGNSGAGQLTGYSSSCTGDCMSEPIAQTVIERLSTLTGIPEINIENLELVRYEEGQFYEGHYDFSFHELHRPQGVRLMTVFLYLSDVEAGGETEFINLKQTLSVTPKRGKALMFGNVMDPDPNTPDRRTKHEALPLKKGVKYGINVWFHQRDFQTAFKHGCTSLE